MTTTLARTGLRRFFGVVADAQTYRNLAYLALTFPLGVLYFTLIWGGGSIGASTLPILVGAPILVGVLAMAVAVADIETRLARGLIGADVSMATPRPSEEPLTEYAKRLITSPQSYLAVVYLLSKFVIGIAAFVALTVASTLSAVLTAAPLLYSRPGVAYQIGSNVVVDTLPEAMVASVVGILLAFVFLHLFNVAARALARYTEVMLDSNATPADTRH